MDVVPLVLGILSLAQAASHSLNTPILPVTLEVKDVPQYFRLQKAVSGEDSKLPQGSLAQSHSETFFIPRLGAREPHVRASLQHIQSQENIPWEILGVRVKGIQGEVVGGEVSPSDPVARVLFHRSGFDGHSRVSQDQCVTVQAAHEALSVQGSCRIQLPFDVCVVELLFSPPWFTLVSTHVNVTLNYSVSEDCKQSREGSDTAGIVQVIGMNSPKVQLLNVGDFLTVTLPDKTLLPGEVFTASVSLRHNWTQPSFTLRGRENRQIKHKATNKRITIEINGNSNGTVAFRLMFRSSLPLMEERVRCRIGLELLFARSAAPNTWAIKTEIQKGAKHHTVTGHLTQRGVSERRFPPVVVFLDFLVSNVSVGFAVSRRITFQLEAAGGGAASTGVRGNAEVLVSDHDLRAIIPIVKSFEILNTAPLTGISQKIPVRVFALEAGGNVMDVTKEAGCETPNAQIIQVSDGCDFLFVGGKETQGAVGVKVEFWLERLRSFLSLSIWVPLLPLRVELSDTNLQRLPGSGSLGNNMDEKEEYRRSASHHRGQSCRPQYQRALVRFLAYFVAHSMDGDHQLTYLLGSDWMLDVSPLIRSQAVIRDQRIARLEEEGSVLIGQQPGVTSVEVRSPLSHSILGEQTISVSPEIVSILELRSNLLWGIFLSVSPPVIRQPSVFTVSYKSQEAIMIPKQEAILSVWLLFSDMSVAPITIYNPQELSLSIVSSDSSVLSVGRAVISANYWSMPVLIYENPGEGPLLRMSLFLPERCKEKETTGLLSAGYIRVTFPRNGTKGDEHPDRDIIQGDTVLLTRDGDVISSANNVIPGTSDIILRSDDTTMEDDKSYSGVDDIVTTRWGIPGLEEGLYGLLAIFSLLTLLFFFSCLAFIRRQRKKSAHEGPGNPEAPNWVWLEGSNADGPKSQGAVAEEEGERGQWDARNLGSQSLTSTFHPVRNCHEAETNGECHSDASLFSTSTNNSKAYLEAKRSEVMSFKTTTTTTTPGEKRNERAPNDPNVQSILVASEEDIVWVCKDMGMREPQEILSYMERIRAETPHQDGIRKEGLRGRGMDLVGARVRKIT